MNQSAELSLLPPAKVQRVALASQTVTGGSKVKLSVTLEDGAPPDGATLQLTSNNQAVAWASGSLQVQGGKTTGSVDISTRAVSTQTVVTLSVTGGGVTRSTNLTVQASATPQPPGGGAVLTDPGCTASTLPANDRDFGPQQASRQFQINHEVAQ